ncbi:MAG TPA: lipoate-protein ligase B, partial [Flavisolibacter sp.]|nr:lipoate-protein ligase B [Flavisolibacter sp.]
MEKQKVEFRDLGRMDYKDAWDYQEVLMQQNLRIKALVAQDGAGPESLSNTRHYLLFVEHPPV